MSNALIVRKIIEDIAKEMHDWSIKSSNMHPSDADGVIGFRKDIPERDNGVGLARIVMQQVTPIES
jgi:hypothetical protein